MFLPSTVCVRHPDQMRSTLAWFATHVLCLNAFACCMTTSVSLQPHLFVPYALHVAPPCIGMSLLALLNICTYCWLVCPVAAALLLPLLPP